MVEPKFKVGDRVRVTTNDENFYRKGDCGEVVRIELNDDPVTYDVLFDKDRACQADWSVAERDLEPEPPSAGRAHRIRVTSAGLHYEVKSLADENDRLRAALDDAERRIGHLKDALARSAFSTDDAHARDESIAESWRLALDEMQARAEKAEAEVARLTAVVEAKTQSANAYRARMIKVSETCDALQAEADTLRAALVSVVDDADAFADKVDLSDWSGAELVAHRRRLLAARPTSPSSRVIE